MDGSASAAPVLFAYDGSEFAKSAIELAGSMLRSNRPAIVLTVCEPFEAVAFGGAAISPGVAEQVDDGILGEARRVAEEGVTIATASGIDAEPLVERGAPIWKVIVDAAEERKASLVVLGSHGRSGITAVLLGSVAGAVVSHSKRPVLISH